MEGVDEANWRVDEAEAKCEEKEGLGESEKGKKATLFSKSANESCDRAL